MIGLIASITLTACGNSDVKETAATEDENDVVEAEESADEIIEEVEEEEKVAWEMSFHESTVDPYKALDDAWSGIANMHYPTEIPFPKEEMSGNTHYYGSTNHEMLSVAIRHDAVDNYEQIGIHGSYEKSDFDEFELYTTKNGIDFKFSDEDKDKLEFAVDGLYYSVSIDDFDEEEWDGLTDSLATMKPLGEKPHEIDFSKYPMPTVLPFPENQTVEARVYTTANKEHYEYTLKFFADGLEREDPKNGLPITLVIQEEEPPYFLDESEHTVVEAGDRVLSFKNDPFQVYQGHFYDEGTNSYYAIETDVKTDFTKEEVLDAFVEIAKSIK